MDDINKNGLEEVDKDAQYLDNFRSIISDIHMFSELTEDDIDDLSKYLSKYKAVSGVEVTREGDTEGYMCIVVKGKLEVMKNGATDDEYQRIAVIRAGRTIGEMTLLDELPHSATIVTSEDSIFLILTKSMFDDMIAQNMALGIKILKIIARLVSLRLRQTSGVLVDVLQNQNNFY